jgi:hypothetical protein
MVTKLVRVLKTVTVVRKVEVTVTIHRYFGQLDDTPRVVAGYVYRNSFIIIIVPVL